MKAGAVLLGHSHLGAIIEAVAEKQSPPAQIDEGFHALIFEVWKFGGESPYLTFEDEKPVFNSEILAEIQSLRRETGMVAVFTSFGGNQHNALALMDHGRPFDFIEGDLDKVKPATEFLPVDQLVELFEEISKRYFLQLECLKRSLDVPIFQFEAPPPIGDSDYVRQHLDEYFSAQNRGSDVSPADLRLKMWRLQRRMLKQQAEKIGVKYLETPKAAFGEDGFLSPSMYGRDATHANIHYGRLVLRQMENILRHKLASWSTFSVANTQTA